MQEVLYLYEGKVPWGWSHRSSDRGGGHETSRQPQPCITGKRLLASHAADACNTMRVLRHLVLAAAAAFTGEQHLVRTTVRRRGTFRDAQHELMDGGAAIELAGDALLADAQRMDFLAANLAIRQPRGVAGVAIKNAGRAIADAGAKFRHKGGLELAAYAVDEAGVYFGGTECAKSLGRLEAPGAARAARAAADVAAALSATGKGLYEQSPAATGAGLGAVAGTCEALADAFDDVPELRAAAAQLRTGAGRLRAGGAVLAGDPEQPKKKKPRRW